MKRLVVNLKAKIMKSLKMKKATDSYDKMEKSESMRVEIRSRKAQKLIQQTMKIADSPSSKTYAL
ncbi:hypothetical protein SDJN02_00360, partial [Cucurbita argyrosperma subsp. argyrosperma]